MEILDIFNHTFTPTSGFGWWVDKGRGVDIGGSGMEGFDSDELRSLRLKVFLEEDLDTDELRPTVGQELSTTNGLQQTGCVT